MRLLAVEKQPLVGYGDWLLAIDLEEAFLKGAKGCDNGRALVVLVLMPVRQRIVVDLDAGPNKLQALLVGLGEEPAIEGAQKLVRFETWTRHRCTCGGWTRPQTDAVALHG